MLFSYKAKKSDGTEYEGTLEAPDKFALYKELHAQGEAVLSVKEKSAKRGLKGALDISFGGTKAAERIMFAKNLSAMLKAGLPLARALSVLERQMTSKAWKPIFIALGAELAKGSAFSSALAAFPKTFTPLFVSMVAAGEESGNLSGSLSIVGDQLEKSYQLQKKVRGAMMYPAIILCLMVAIGVLMFIYVVPKLTSTFKEFNVELPFATRLIIGASDLMQAHYLSLLAAVVAFVVAFVFFRKSASGKRFFGKLVIKLPVIGTIAKEVNSARTARTLSSLLSSGVDVVHAIRITSSVVQNVHYQNMLNRTAEGIQKGSTLQSLFMPRGDIYPPFVAEMIGVGEETGSLSKVLVEVATFYEGEVDQKTKDMSSIIEPFLMVAIGVGVGFFALAIISPIYSLSNNI
ncbi:MAG: type II secretion system F family protein [Candidatus Taylorbacteria bacterium]|nr:type II secretion system F family protein [Candidatus Taylorbacteria bacterium]